MAAVLRGGEDGEPAAVRFTTNLRASRDTLPIAGAVMRDERNEVVAVGDPSDAQRPIPDLVLDLDTLVPAARSGPEPAGLALPESGGRIALASGGRRFGWLDVWGNGRWATLESRRALSDVARFLSLLLASLER